MLNGKLMDPGEVQKYTKYKTRRAEKKVPSYEKDAALKPSPVQMDSM